MILVAVTPTGELLTLRPVYFIDASETLEHLEDCSIILVTNVNKPVGYAGESLLGGQMFGAGILDLVEVLGEL